MIFSDPSFFVFFSIYFVLHVLTPAKYRVYLIIAGSCVFYAWWRVIYIFLPFLLTAIAWGGVEVIERTTTQQARKRALIVTLILLFVPLALAKYAYFFSSQLALAIPSIESSFGDLETLKIALPLGISFITFTLTAYVVDVYKGKYIREKLTILLAYVFFFPHLIAGPILRPHEMMPQLKQLRKAMDARFLLGISLFTLGLVKKVVFADQIGALVDPVFEQGYAENSLAYILAIYGFSVQIYCDFSGYTDMAIGLAYVLRIRLPTNFLRPYASRNIVEFWRRWHITLSHWLRDYLYIPLGGSRVARPRHLANLMITMVLGGLWHGAAWTFVLWGALHGLALGAVTLFSIYFGRAGKSLPVWLGVFLTFNFVTFAWIFFRAGEVDVAFLVISGAFANDWAGSLAVLQSHAFECFAIVVFFLTHCLDRHSIIRRGLKHWNKGIVVLVLITVWLLVVSLSQTSSAKFIYFDF
jgi:alginate O-acetyltransferase complex protein AlgI